MAPEDQLPVGDQTSGVSPVGDGAKAPIDLPPIQNISSSHEQGMKKTFVMHEEPSTGAWYGPPCSDNTIVVKISQLERSFKRLNDKIVALPGNIMAQMTYMEMRLRARIEELYDKLNASLDAVAKSPMVPNSETPRKGKHSNPAAGDQYDYMLQKILIDGSGSGGTLGRGCKRGGGAVSTDRKARKEAVRRVTGRRLFSPSTADKKDKDLGAAHEPRIPPWIPVAFNPMKNMPLDAADVAVVAYTWSLEQTRKFFSEILVDHPFLQATQKQLQCIAPGGRLSSEIISLAACMLTSEERSILGGSLRWWLPTEFTQYACSSDRDLDEVARFYRDDFMGLVDSLTKIFIPMYDDDHWYLMIVDMVRGELVYLDSKSSKVKRQIRERQMRKVGIFLEEMLEDRTFYKRARFPIPNVSAFTFTSPPNIQEQKNGVDCSVCVCRWMSITEHWSRFNLGDVDEYARVRLLVDLIRKPYNGQGDAIVERACTFMEQPGRMTLKTKE